MLKHMLIAVAIACSVAACEEAFSAEKKATSKERNDKPLILSKPEGYQCLMCKNGKIKRKGKSK